MKKYLELCLAMIAALLVSCTGEGYYGPQGRGEWNQMMVYGGYDLFCSDERRWL